MQPAVRRLQETYGDSVAFEVIDANSERGSGWFAALALPGHPSYVIFDGNGQEIFRTFGVVEDEVLAAPLRGVLE